MDYTHTLGDTTIVLFKPSNMPRRIAICSAAALSIVTALIVANSPSSSASTELRGSRPTSPAASSSSLPVELSIALGAADRISERLSNEYPTAFSGEYISDQNNTLNINFVGSVPNSAREEVAHALTGLTASYHSVAYSAADLNASAASLKDSLPKLQTDGIDVQSFGPDYQNDAIDVRLSSTPTAAAEQELQTASGRVPIEMLPSGHGYKFGFPTSPNPQGGGSSTGTVTPYDSTTDFSPYYGGDDMGSATQAHYCTSGFNIVTIYGVVEGTTAGHCGNQNYTTAGQPMGTSAFIHDGQSGDTEMIGYVSGKTGSPAIWTSTTTAGPVSQSGSLPQGIAGVCAGLGVSRWYDCNGTVEQTNQTINFLEPNGTWVSIGGLALLYDQTLNNRNGGSFGDSGSPIYQTITGGNIRADGEFIGDLLYENSYDYEYYAEPLPTILSLLGSSLYHV